MYSRIGGPTFSCASKYSLNLYTSLLKSMMVLCLAAGTAQAGTRVVVATESWGQLMYLDKDSKPSGVLADFVGRMNQVQDKFTFELAIYPRLRLDRIFIDKQADVYPLRNVAWTDPALELLPTRTILTSGDVYVAHNSNRYGGRAVFTDLKSRRIAGVRGYHYQLFDNNPDEAYIKTHFSAYLFSSNEAVINFLLVDRADIGIVPEVVMANTLADPAMRAKLIVSERFDSRFELSNLVRKDGPMSVDDMNGVIELLVKSGDVDKLKARLSVEQYRSAKK